MKMALAILSCALLMFSTTALYGLNQSDAAQIERAGVVFSVDYSKNQIIIKVTENGKPRNTLFLLTEDTTLSDADGSPILLDKVEMGDEVVVHFTKAKKKNIVRILRVES